MGGQAVIIGGFALILRGRRSCCPSPEPRLRRLRWSLFCRWRRENRWYWISRKWNRRPLDAVPRAYVEVLSAARVPPSSQAAACVDFSLSELRRRQYLSGRRSSRNPGLPEPFLSVSATIRSPVLQGLSGIGAVCDNAVGPACQIGGGQGGNGAPGSQCPFKNHGVGRGNAVCYLPVYEFCVCQLSGIIIRVRCGSGRNAGKKQDC